MERVYTCDEIAKRYGVKISTVYKWIRDGAMQAINIGKGYRIKESSVIEFEECNKTRR